MATLAHINNNNKVFVSNVEENIEGKVSSLRGFFIDQLTLVLKKMTPAAEEDALRGLLEYLEEAHGPEDEGDGVWGRAEEAMDAVENAGEEMDTVKRAEEVMETVQSAKAMDAVVDTVKVAGGDDDNCSKGEAHGLDDQAVLQTLGEMFKLVGNDKMMSLKGMISEGGDAKAEQGLEEQQPRKQRSNEKEVQAPEVQLQLQHQLQQQQQQIQQQQQQLQRQQQQLEEQKQQLHIVEAKRAALYKEWQERSAVSQNLSKELERMKVKNETDYALRRSRDENVKGCVRLLSEAVVMLMTGCDFYPWLQFVIGNIQRLTQYVEDTHVPPSGLNTRKRQREETNSNNK